MKILVIILFVIGFSLSHKVEDDEIEGLFDTSSDEE